MQINLTDGQKQILVSAVIALLIAVGALFGYTVKVMPAAPAPAITAKDISESRFGSLRVDGGSTLSGATTFGSTVTFGGGGVVAGSAEGSVAYSTVFTATIAQINAGVTVVTVPAARSFRLIDSKAIAYGGACAAVTTVDLLAGATKLVTYAQAQLTQSTPLVIGGTGVTILADGASFMPQPIGQIITISKTGSSVTTCTGVKFILTYALE